jgi:hypothetical protein
MSSTPSSSRAGNLSARRRERSRSRAANLPSQLQVTAKLDARTLSNNPHVGPLGSSSIDAAAGRAMAMAILGGEFDEMLSSGGGTATIGTSSITIDTASTAGMTPTAEELLERGDISNADYHKLINLSPRSAADHIRAVAPQALLLPPAGTAGAGMGAGVGGPLRACAPTPPSVPSSRRASTASAEQMRRGIAFDVTGDSPRMLGGAPAMARAKTFDHSDAEVARLRAAAAEARDQLDAKD